MAKNSHFEHLAFLNFVLSTVHTCIYTNVRYNEKTKNIRHLEMKRDDARKEKEGKRK